jgi:hypothetical protein
MAFISVRLDPARGRCAVIDVIGGNQGARWGFPLSHEEVEGRDLWSHDGKGVKGFKVGVPLGCFWADDRWVVVVWLHVIEILTTREIQAVQQQSTSKNGVCANLLR